MAIQSDIFISFGIACHFQPQKSKNIKNFSYPKIFKDLKTTISRLLLMPGGSASAQTKGFRISIKYLINT